MKEIKPYLEKNEDFVEAELLGKTYQQKPKMPPTSLFSRILARSGRLIFFISFSFALLLIILGSLLSMTVLGAIIGIPLIILGIAILLAGLKIYFTLSGKTQGFFRHL
ncbi:MAG: hypothetical protein Fur0012_12910 [Elusimicrobiota bacterium]